METLTRHYHEQIERPKVRVATSNIWFEVFFAQTLNRFPNRDLAHGPRPKEPFLDLFCALGARSGLEDGFWPRHVHVHLLDDHARREVVENDECVIE